MECWDNPERVILQPKNWKTANDACRGGAQADDGLQRNIGDSSTRISVRSPREAARCCVVSVAAYQPATRSACAARTDGVITHGAIAQMKDAWRFSVTWCAGMMKQIFVAFSLLWFVSVAPAQTRVDTSLKGFPTRTPKKNFGL